MRVLRRGIEGPQGLKRALECRLEAMQGYERLYTVRTLCGKLCDIGRW